MATVATQRPRILLRRCEQMMLMYTKIIDPDIPIEDHVSIAKHYLKRMHEGDIIDWATMHYDVGVTTFEGVDVTLMTLTVESALSMATTFGEPA